MSDIRISSVEGNRQLLDGGAMFGNAPRPVWEKWIQPDSIGRIPLACRSLLIEIDDKKILCETGIGVFFEPKLAERFGVQNSNQHMLIENLRAMGISPEQIDYVILSHLHFDHAGGLLPSYQEMQSGHNGLAFPNATVLVGAEAWDRAQHPHSRDKASFIPGLVEKLKASGRLIVVGEDPLPKLFKDHIEFIFTHGHTPGHMHTLFKGNQRRVFFCGDLVPGQPWVHLPITMGYDRFAEMVIDEKANVFKRAEPEHWLMFYTHDPEFACSEVSKNETGRFEPKHSMKSVARLSL